MSDFRVTTRPALGHHTPGEENGIYLAPLPEGCVIHVLGKPGDTSLPGLCATAAGAIPHSVRAGGPGQYFIIGNEPLMHDAFKAISAVLAEQAAASDQSHGRVRIAVSGTGVELMLSAGTALDTGAVQTGEGTTTLFGHISAHITRTGENAFELMVLRGFAESLYEDLLRMRAAHG